MNNKGNAYILFITITFSITILFFLIIFMLFMQINNQVYKLKQDVFYIVQNSYFSLNQESFSYSDYIIDNKELFEKVNYIMQKNNPDGNVKIISMYYDYKKNKVNISYTLKLKPVVLGDIIKDININFNDDIKLKGMEVE